MQCCGTLSFRSLTQGDYPENLIIIITVIIALYPVNIYKLAALTFSVVLSCPNKQPSFEPFMCSDLVSVTTLAAVTDSCFRFSKSAKPKIKHDRTASY